MNVIASSPTSGEATRPGFAERPQADDHAHIDAVLPRRVGLRERETGTLEDGRPGGGAVHGLLAWEEQAILDLIEQWGPVDRSHRKLAHRGSYTDTVFVSPSTLLSPPLLVRP